MRTISILLAGFLFLGSCRDLDRAPEKAKVLSTNDTDWQGEEKMANMFYDKDDFNKSVVFFTRLIGRDSTNGEYYFKRGYSFARLEDKKRAIEDFQRALKHKYNASSCYYNIGLAYSYESDSLSLLYFKKCLTIDSQDTAAKVQIYFCEKRLKHPRTPLPSFR